MKRTKLAAIVMALALPLAAAACGSDTKASPSKTNNTVLNAPGSGTNANTGGAPNAGGSNSADQGSSGHSSTPQGVPGGTGGSGDLTPGQPAGTP